MSWRKSSASHMPSAISIHILCSGGQSHIPWMLSHALGNFNLHSLLRRSLAHSLNVASRPRQFQFTFPAPAVARTFLECCLMPSAISIYIPRSGGHSHIPWMLPHALGNFNLYSLLRRSLAHSLNVASCPRQFQFTFPAPAVIRTFLECCLMPSAISIYIPCSGGHSHIPWMLPHALGNFNLYSPLRRSITHSLNVAFMPSAISIYIPAPWSLAHSLNVASCPRQFQFTFSAPAVIRTFLECCLIPSAISIYIPRSGGHSHIPWMLPHALGNFNLHSPLRRSLTHSLNVASCPRQFQFIIPRSGGQSHIPWMSPHALGSFNLHFPLRRSFTYSLNVLSCPRQFQFTFPAPASRPQLPNKYYNFLYTSPFSSCFPGSAVHACSPYNSQFQTLTVHDSQFLQSRPAPGT